MKNTHRNNTLSHLAALAARRFATIALMFAASAGALPRLASAQTATLTVLADLGTLPNQDKGRSRTDYGGNPGQRRQLLRHHYIRRQRQLWHNFQVNAHGHSDRHWSTSPAPTAPTRSVR